MVVGMFESLVGAQRAVADLVDSGYRRNAISVLVRHPPGGVQALGSRVGEQGPLARATESARAMDILGGGPLGAALHTDVADATETTVIATLANAGLDASAASFLAAAICNGAILVAVHCPQGEVRDARDILDTYTDFPGESATRRLPPATGSRPS